VFRLLLQQKTVNGNLIGEQYNKIIKSHQKEEEEKEKE
jgi:hypothetical protein